MPHEDHTLSRLSASPPPAQRLGVRRTFALLTAAAVALVISGPSLPAEAASNGSLTVTPGRSATTAIGGSFADGSAAVAFTLPGTAARPVYLAVQLRSPESPTGYRARVSVGSDGALKAGFSRVRGGSETLLLSESIAGTVTPGQTIRLEGLVQGSSPVRLSVRAWVDGSAKPGWQKSYSDSSGDRLTAGGAARVWSYLSSAATTPATLSFKDATAGPVVTAAPAPARQAGAKPSATSTGVRAGSTLNVHTGDIVVTKDGTRLENMDINGFVVVRARDVTISNSIVRGGRATQNQGLITNYGYPGLVIEDTDVVARYPSVWLDGIKGNNFIARRVHVVGNVDSVKIQGDNVTIEDSLLENTQYWSSDPNQGGSPTHNDNIQILFGRNLTVDGNTIRGATNFAILGAASLGDTPNLVIRNNWLDGGHCTVKLQTLSGHSLTATVTNNKFGPNRAVRSCPFQAEPAVSLTASGNVYELDGLPVPILRVVS